jgi:putative ABC transport system permease protein
VSPAETLRIAVAGIAANKLRSGLTILGMTIGVAAVIVLVAVGNGSKQQVQAGIDALGSNVLIVQAQNGPGGPGGLRFGGGGGGLTLTTDDATALQDAFNAPDVKTAAPVVNATGTTLVAG